MSRGKYSLGKRQREQERSRKKRDKAEKRQVRRERGASDVEVVDREIEAVPTVEEVMKNMMGGSRGKGSSAPPCRLFVGGMSHDTSEASLREALGAFGPISDSVIIKDRQTGMSRGFGFVTMESRRDAKKAIEALNDTELDGRHIVVKVASERDR